MQGNKSITQGESSSAPTRASLLSLPPLLLPGHYLALVFVACLDILGTWTILAMGGREVNVIAASVMQTFGFDGMIVYKFALVALMIVLCEEVTRRRVVTGVRLAIVLVGVTFLPFAYAVGQVVISTTW